MPSSAGCNVSLWTNGTFTIKMRQWTENVFCFFSFLRPSQYKVTLLETVNGLFFKQNDVNPCQKCTSSFKIPPFRCWRSKHECQHATCTRSLEQKPTEGISVTLHSDPNEANKHAKPRCFSHYQGRRTAPNKGFSKRGVSRASEVLVLATLVTRSAEREGGERQKILYAYGSNLYKSVFVTKTWLGFFLNSYFYILEHHRGQLTYECSAFG